jgi:hypothetical protein
MRYHVQAVFFADKKSRWLSIYIGTREECDMWLRFQNDARIYTYRIISEEKVS